MKNYTEKKYVYLKKEQVRLIEDLAEKENRKFSAMLRILITLGFERKTSKEIPD